MDDLGFKFTRASRSTPEQKEEKRLAALERRKLRPGRRVIKESDTGIKCTECGSGRLETKESRPYLNMQRRRRDCKVCGHRFYTLEMPESCVPDADEMEARFDAVASLLTRAQQAIKR